ncbi:MAG TPA: 3-oxo-tetronate kinase [Pyrinomonadaceae bacterium]
MSRLVFAAIADDDTGASDLAGMLAEQGMRTLLVIDLPTVEQFLHWSDGYQAVVMAEGTRNLPPLVAQERTRQAIRTLKERNPRVFQIKYCSTFDSTPEGNIGPSIDAALDELNEEFTIALPALPVNGRTTYQGYHFVNGQLLSDSSMRDHPLTPMTNPNLVDLLSRQTKRPVGLAAYADVEGGADQLTRCFQRLQEQGVSIAVVDCLNNTHLRTIVRAASDLRLLTGSSAFGIELPAIFRERGWISDQMEGMDAPDAAPGDDGCLLVAGSCSVATQSQNEWLALQEGVSVQHLNPRELLDDEFNVAAIVAQVRNQLAAGRHCLLKTTETPAEVRQMQEWGARQGLSIPDLGQRIAYAVADLIREILQNQNVCGLVIAGGETSGALCRRLELGALRVGRNIEPGVPLCFSLGRFRLPVVLKSGNFGSRDFYGKALRAIAQPNRHLV